MSRSPRFIAVATLAAVLLSPGATLAFDPPPGPSGKRMEQQRKGQIGRGAKDFKAPERDTRVLLPAVQSSREAARRAR